MRILIPTSSLLLLLVTTPVAVAFQHVSVFNTKAALTHRHRHQSNKQQQSLTVLFETVAPSDADINEVAMNLEMSAAIAKEELLELVKDLKAKYGLLLIDGKAKESFKEAVEKLETVAEPPTDTAGLLGAWTLLCTTASSDVAKGISGIDTSKIPFFNDGPVKDIRETMNKSLRVEQIIKSTSSDGIDSIDHVIEYSPPNTLASVLKNLPDNLPEPIKTLNINPLQVSETKVYLKHKAEVESVIPTMKTKLSLSSIVVNVAGKSQILDPAGGDVLGINVPFGEFLNAGTFDTTYLDDTVRISRSKVGIVDQIRVFMKTSEADTVAPYEAPSSPTVEVVDGDDDELADDAIVAVDADVIVDDDTPSDVE